MIQPDKSTFLNILQQKYKQLSVSLTCCYLLLLLLPGVTWCYLVVPGVTWCYLVLPQQILFISMFLF